MFAVKFEVAGLLIDGIFESCFFKMAKVKVLLANFFWLKNGLIYLAPTELKS